MAITDAELAQMNATFDRGGLWLNPETQLRLVHEVEVLQKLLRGEAQNIAFRDSKIEELRAALTELVCGDLLAEADLVIFALCEGDGITSGSLEAEYREEAIARHRARAGLGQE